MIDRHVVPAPDFPTWTRVVVALTCGGVLGLLSWRGDRFPPQFAIIFNLGGPWLLLAWMLGGWTERIPLGARTGAVTLVTGVLAYYGAYELSSAPLPAVIARLILAWLAIAAFTGAVFGMAGAARRSARRWTRIGSVSLMASALLVEVLAAVPDLVSTSQGPDATISEQAGLVTVAGYIVARDARLPVFALQSLGSIMLLSMGLRTKTERGVGIVVTIALSAGGVLAVSVLHAGLRWLQQ